MKKLSILLLVISPLFFSCENFISGDNPEVKTRYFMIGYDASNSNTRSYGTWYRKSYDFPNLDSLKILIYNTIGCDSDISLSDVRVTSIFEFKDSVDFKTYSSNNKLSSWTTNICDSTKPYIK